MKFQLPTEAQWEKAARGIDSRKFPWGSREPDGDLANIYNIMYDTMPVGSYPAGASPYSILDMAGNVWEWCNDWYDGGYYKNSPKINPLGPSSGSIRVLRGGSCFSEAGLCRATSRYAPLSLRDFNVGFRLAGSL